MRSRVLPNPAAHRPPAGIGGMVLVTSTGFHGSYLRSSQSISMMAIVGDGTGMERDYDFTSALHGSDLGRRPASAAAPASARWRAPIRARSPPARCRWCMILASRGRWWSCRRRGQRRVDRAQDQFPERPARPAVVREGHPHRRRSACGCAACARNPSMPKASRKEARGDRRRRADVVAAGFGDRARTRTDDHRPRPPRRVVVAVAGIVQPASRSRDA